MLPNLTYVETTTMDNRMVFIYDPFSFNRPVWVTFWGIYMYGPCSTLDELLYYVYTDWESEHCICG